MNIWRHKLKKEGAKKEDRKNVQKGAKKEDQYGNPVDHHLNLT